MKGLSEALKPFLATGGRITLDTVLTFAMNSDMVDDEGDDFRRETYKANITSLFNQNDFYSVGNGVFCFIDDMTDEEIQKTATKLDSTGHRYIEKAEKLLAGHGYINPETMEVEFPEPVVLGE